MDASSALAHIRQLILRNVARIFAPGVLFFAWLLLNSLFLRNNPLLPWTGSYFEMIDLTPGDASGIAQLACYPSVLYGVFLLNLTLIASTSDLEARRYRVNFIFEILSCVCLIRLLTWLIHGFVWDEFNAIALPPEFLGWFVFVWLVVPAFNEQR